MNSELRNRTQKLAIAFVYWAAIAPAAFLLRLTGRGGDPPIDRSAPTYWQSRRT